MSRRRRPTGGGFDGVVNQFLNNSTFNSARLEESLYLRMIMSLAVSRFRWEGFPEEIDERFIEIELFQKGLVVFFHEDENYGRYFATSATTNGPINQYRNPTAFRPYGPRFEHKTLSGNECVPIWCNELRVPEYDVLVVFARRLAEFDKSIDVLNNRVRIPWIFTVPQSQRKSAQEFWRQVEQGEPAVFGTEALQELVDNIKTLDMRVEPRTIGELQVAKTRVWNECMGYLGINNANQDKKERLVEAETSANDSQVMISRRASLAARKRAAEAINKKYSLNVTVKWSDELELLRTATAAGLGFENGGDNNGGSDNEAQGRD